MKKNDRNICDYSWTVINGFLLNPCSVQCYNDLILNIEGIDSYFEIEDKDFLDCVNEKVDNGFNSVVTVATSGLKVYRGFNHINNHNFFELSRLFVKFAVKDDVKLCSSNYYSKDDLNYLIKMGMIYPLSYSYKYLDYIPKDYVEISDEELCVPYVCKYDFLKESFSGFRINKDYMIYDYYISKLRDKYPIERVLNILKEKFKKEFYRDYVGSRYHNSLKKFYLEKQEEVNKLCSKYGVSELNFITIDKLDEYLVGQIGICKEERYKDLDYKGIVYLLNNSIYLTSEMLERIRNAIIMLNDSKLCCELVMDNSFIYINDMLDVIINNNDAESCYKLLIEYYDNYSKGYLLKMFKVIVLSGNKEYINNIIDMGIIRESDAKKLVKR